MSGRAWLVYVFNINHNILTAWRWARGDSRSQKIVLLKQKRNVLFKRKLVIRGCHRPFPRRSPRWARSKARLSSLKRTKSLHTLARFYTTQPHFRSRDCLDLVHQEWSSSQLTSCQIAFDGKLPPRGASRLMALQPAISESPNHVVRVHDLLMQKARTTSVNY